MGDMCTLRNRTHSEAFASGSGIRPNSSKVLVPRGMCTVPFLAPGSTLEPVLMGVCQEGEQRKGTGCGQVVGAQGSWEGSPFSPRITYSL